MGHRIAVLNAGKLQQVGTPLEVYERPQNLFVANFIGTPPMNFVRATVTDGKLAAASFTLPVPAAAREALKGRLGRTVVVGIRPENVIEPGRRTSGATAPLDLIVDLVETLGDEVVIHGSQGDESPSRWIRTIRRSSATRSKRSSRWTASISSTRTRRSASPTEGGRTSTPAAREWAALNPALGSSRAPAHSSR